MRHGLFVGRGAAEEFVKGGFRAKMDRKEAIQILGLKSVFCFISFRASFG
jgi:DnaJ family protein C protein 19